MHDLYGVTESERLKERMAWQVATVYKSISTKKIRALNNPKIAK